MVKTPGAKLKWKNENGFNGPVFPMKLFNALNGLSHALCYLSIENLDFIRQVSYWRGDKSFYFVPNFNLRVNLSLPMGRRLKIWFLFNFLRVYLNVPRSYMFKTGWFVFKIISKAPIGKNIQRLTWQKLPQKSCNETNKKNVSTFASG